MIYDILSEVFNKHAFHFLGVRPSLGNGTVLRRRLFMWCKHIFHPWNKEITDFDSDTVNINCRLFDRNPACFHVLRVPDTELRIRFKQLRGKRLLGSPNNHSDGLNQSKAHRTCLEKLDSTDHAVYACVAGYEVKVTVHDSGLCCFVSWRLSNTG